MEASYCMGATGKSFAFDDRSSSGELQMRGRERTYTSDEGSVGQRERVGILGVLTQVESRPHMYKIVL